MSLSWGETESNGTTTAHPSAHPSSDPSAARGIADGNGLQELTGAWPVPAGHHVAAVRGGSCRRGGTGRVGRPSRAGPRPGARTYTQTSDRPVAVLAAEPDISQTTTRCRKVRREVHDRPHAVERLASGQSLQEERAVGEPRRYWPCCSTTSSWSCAAASGPACRTAPSIAARGRHGLNRRPSLAKPPVGRFAGASIGFIHLEVRHLLDLRRQKAHPFVSIDCATRYVRLEVQPCCDAAAAAVLKRFFAHFPHPVHTVLADNSLLRTRSAGSETIDRSAVDVQGKPLLDGSPFLFAGKYRVADMARSRWLYRAASPDRRSRSGVGGGWRSLPRGARSGSCRGRRHGSPDW